MKKTFKKMAALLMAVAMVITSMSFTAFAADTTITVQDVESGAKVMAYQIVKYDSANGKWLNMDGTEFNKEDITADWVTNKAKSVSGGIELEEVNGAYKSNTNDNNKTEGGLYLVLVTKANSTWVYNPMIVAVDFKQGSQELSGNSVSANSTFTYGEETAYAKRSKVPFDKEIVNADRKTGQGAGSGDTMKPGDTAEFKIETTIPAYSKVYDNAKLKFEIKDTVSAGLNTPYDIVVKNGNTTLQVKDAEHPDNYDYELDGPGEGRTFTIKFKRSYLLSDAAKPITVTYKADLNEQAATGFDANTNTAELEYTNGPNFDTNKDKDRTYHYTFEIDGNVGLKFAENGKKVSREIIKTKVDELTGEEVLNVIDHEEVTEEQWKERAVAKDEAKFAIYHAEQDANGKWVAKDNGFIQEVGTNDNGRMNFKKLDEGHYVIVETKAPAGYAKNTTPIHAEIRATLNEDGTLNTYSVLINGTENKYKSTYETGEDGFPVVKTTVHDEGSTQNTTEFQNTKVGTLPSTGGMGTIIFTVAGIAIMAIAAGLLIAKKASK